MPDMKDHPDTIRFLFKGIKTSDVDFDVQDAVDKLIRWGMIEVGPDGRMVARRPETVIAALRSRLEKQAAVVKCLEEKGLKEVSSPVYLDQMDR